jgi:hypothetical protein
MVVPIVAAITALRSCALCSLSDIPLDTAVLAILRILPET